MYNKKNEKNPWINNKFTQNMIAFTAVVNFQKLWVFHFDLKY